MRPLINKNQLQLLSIFLINPDKPFYMQEIGRIIGKKPGAFQHTLNSLQEEGLLTSEYRANARFFQANTQHPLYPELKKIISKTVGAEGILHDLVKKVKEVKLAFIYGSFAKGTERSNSDIDLLIVGKPQVEAKLLKEIPQLEKKLQREINYKLYSEKEYRKKKKGGESFLEEVLSDKKIILKGNPDAI